MLNDARYRIELNGISHGPDTGLGGIGAVTMLVYAKADLYKEQIGRKGNVIDQLGSKAEPFPLVVPGGSIFVGRMDF